MGRSSDGKRNILWGRPNINRAKSVCIYGLLTSHEVKKAGYWPSSFFACLWTETKSRSINPQKRTRPINPAILIEKAWSKVFLAGHGG